MPLDRSKWKAAPLSTVSETVQQTKQYDTYFGGKGEYAQFWKQRDGITVKRVLPAHEPGDSPYVPMLTAMLKCEVDEKDKEGKVIGKKISNKKIFLATLHGGYPYDIIEEYIKRVYEQAEQFQDKEERARFLNPITGYRMGGKNGTWVPGIRPQLEYVYYAFIEGKIYRDSLKPKQMEALNKESADLCAQNDTAAIDMFSDPSTGFPIQWSRGKDENNKTVETLKSLPLKVGQTWEDYFEKNAVSDKVLEELEGLPSLQKLYVDCYGKRDFDYALDGLKRFDDANSYKIFAQDDFLDMVEELQNMIEEKTGEKPSGADDLPFGPSEEEKKPEAPVASAAKKATPAAKAPAKRAVTKKKAEPTPEEKLKVVNEEFIRQYGEGYEELDLEGAELEEAYQLALKHEDLGYDIEHVPGWDGSDDSGEDNGEEYAGDNDGGDEPDPEPEDETPAPTPGVRPASDAGSSSGQSAIDRIRAMRNKKK